MFTTIQFPPQKQVVLLVFVASFSGLSCWSAEVVGAENNRRPNVLLIMTDDQGFGDVHSHGNPQIDTPVHDQIAASGARFDRFFVSPVCAPTRASLLTGRWHLRTGVHGVTRGRETMRSDEITLAEILRDAGYATGAFGKWHNGAHFPQHPNGQGFDQFYGFCAGHWNNYFDTFVERNGERENYEGFIIDRMTDEAIEFIQGSSDRPWFCYVPYNTPHSPWQVPDRYWDKYKSADLKDDKARCAYAMVENIDDNMGRLLKAVESLQQTEDTIVIFLTDNGANSDRYNAGMKGRKGSLHEGGTRVPFFVRWPGHIPAGTVIPSISAHIDVLPTVAELVQVELPSSLKLDGTSLVPLLLDQLDDKPERTLFAHWGDNARGVPLTDRGAVRTDRWRAVQYNRQWELYDMQKDPGQRQDLAGEHPQVLAGLKQQYEQWFQDVTRDGFAVIPTEIGHAAAPKVTLPGHEANLHPGRGQGISYRGRAGWANDFVTHWTDPTAFPSWDVKVVKPGRYALSLEYAADTAAIGSLIEVAIGPHRIQAKIGAAQQAPPIPSPDRVARKEVFERQWGWLEIGELPLQAGVAKLTVKCLDQESDEVMELKSVQLERID
ncbi:MAG: arylsulfatase [Planctomycetaceae bacterium]|nr:arylsulfatase [Planctomycetaceae bacterium]